MKEEQGKMLLDRREFVKLWQTATSMEELMNRTGQNYNQLYNRAAYFKRRGVPLKDLSGANTWESLAEYAKSFNGSENENKDPRSG